MKNSKDDRTKAEHAAEWMAVKVFQCNYTRRALAQKYGKVDFFASDIMGMRDDGVKVFIQATAGQDQAVTARRRKLEKFTWHPSDWVMVAQLKKEPDPKNLRKFRYWFRVSVYVEGKWHNSFHEVEIKREWFKAYKQPEE